MFGPFSLLRYECIIKRFNCVSVKYVLRNSMRADITNHLRKCTIILEWKYIVLFEWASIAYIHIKFYGNENYVRMIMTMCMSIKALNLFWEIYDKLITYLYVRRSKSITAYLWVSISSNIYLFNCKVKYFYKQCYVFFLKPDHIFILHEN